MRTVAVWVGAVACWAAFVAFTSIGPVVVSLGWRHGVHATDILSAMVVVLGCSIYTVTRTAPCRRRSRSVAEDRPRTMSAP